MTLILSNNSGRQLASLAIKKICIALKLFLKSNKSKIKLNLKNQINKFKKKNITS